MGARRVTKSIHGSDGAGVQAEVDVPGHGEGFVIHHAVHPPARETQAIKELAYPLRPSVPKGAAWWHVPSLGLLVTSPSPKPR